MKPLVRFFLAVAGLSILTLTSLAQEASGATGPSPRYRVEAEVTVQGTLKEGFRVAGQRKLPGTLVMFTAFSQAIPVHLGPSASKLLKKLQGKNVKVVGAAGQVSGSNVLLVRELVVDGKTIVLRNRNGIVIMDRGSLPRVTMR